MADSDRSFPRSAGRPPPTEALLVEALTHHQANRIDRAEALYRRILADEPHHIAALSNMAMLHHQRQALAEAEHWYAKALAVRRTPELLSNIATLRRAQGDLKEAEKLLKEALALRPDFPDALYNLGVTLIDADRPGDAIAPLARRARDPRAGADVHANLARALYAIGRAREGLRHGRQALLIKDSQACTAFSARGEQLLPQEPAPSFDPAKPQHNVIAFSLWGDRATYVEGAIANVALARGLYPGWVCRIYADISVPLAAIETLGRAGAQIVMMPRAENHFGLFWRFLAADDPQVRYFLCRDADARLNTQEQAAVAAWLGSGRPFHIMRDAPYHTELMLAGLWGGVGGRLRGIRNWIDRVYQPASHRWVDQDFLRLEVWPRIRGQTLIHDGWYDVLGAEQFPPEGRLTPSDHVGAGRRLPDSAAGVAGSGRL